MAKYAHNKAARETTKFPLPMPSVEDVTLLAIAKAINPSISINEAESRYRRVCDTVTRDIAKKKIKCFS